MGFTVYDPNMNKINFPAGIKPLDFLVSSIQKERISEQVEGIPGNVNFGFTHAEREITLTFWLTHIHGEHDYHLMQGELNAFFDTFEYIYISSEHLPSRVLRITVDESFVPERITGSYVAKIEIPAKTCGLPYWRTTYTTQDLQIQKYSALRDRYGWADGIHLDYPDYTFTSKEFTVWNAGNVPVSYIAKQLYIRVNYLTTSGNFTIENITTGEKFIYKTSLSEVHLTVDGANVQRGTFNALRDTNRVFLTLVPGENKFKISNGTFENIQFDFPFLYK